MSEPEPYQERKRLEDVEDDKALFYPQKLFITAILLIILATMMLVIGNFVHGVYYTTGLEKFAKV